MDLDVKKIKILPRMDLGNEEYMHTLFLLTAIATVMLYACVEF